MYSTKHMEDLQISYISALCASVGIDYDIQGHDADSTDAIIKRNHFANGSWYFSQLRITIEKSLSVNRSMKIRETKSSTN